MTQSETTALWPPSLSLSPHRLIRILKVIYSNIRGEASKVHLADKDAIADRNVVPGARLQLCILHSSSLTHRHIDSFFSSPPPLCPCRLSVLLSPSRQCFLFCLFSILPTPTPSLPPTSCSSPPICPHFHLHISFPIPPSPTPAQLPPSSVILISWPFQGNHSS